MRQETPKSLKDAWRESILQHELPDHVTEDLEYVRFTEPGRLSNIERNMLHPDADKFSPDERELSYLQANLSLPRRFTDGETRARQRKIDVALRNRGRELIDKIGRERAPEILGRGKLGLFGIQE